MDFPHATGITQPIQDAFAPIQSAVNASPYGKFFGWGAAFVAFLIQTWPAIRSSVFAIRRCFKWRRRSERREDNRERAVDPTFQNIGEDVAQQLLDLNARYEIDKEIWQAEKSALSRRIQSLEARLRRGAFPHD